MTQKKFLAEGDFKIVKARMTNFDASQYIDIDLLIDSLIITESIFNPFIMGQMSITDGMGIHQSFPIQGEETVEFLFEDSKGRQRSFSFVVYKMSDKSRGDKQAYNYTLHLCSPEAIKNQTISLSRGYQNKSIAEIVKDMFSEISDTTPFIEDTIHTQNLIIPTLTPIETVSWCASFATSKKYQKSPYLFFQNKAGFNFVTIDSLLDQTPLQEYMQLYVKADIGIQPVSSKTDEGKEIKLIGRERNITEYAVVQQFDHLDSLDNGVYGSTVTVFDPLAKKFRVDKYDYETNYNDTKKLNKSTFANNTLIKSDSVMQDSAKSVTKAIPSRNLHLVETYAKSKNLTPGFVKKREDNFLNRIAQLSELNHTIVSGMVGINCDLTAGKLLTLQIPGATVKRNTPAIDPYISGDYLVTIVRHTITRKKYAMNFDAVRNTLVKKREYETSMIEKK